MDFKTSFYNHEAFLMEGALGERLKREYGLMPDKNLALAKHVHSMKGRSALKELWMEYAAIADTYGLPFLAVTPTRRVNRERAGDSGTDVGVIGDNVSFLQRIKGENRGEMYAGGMVGSRGDAYTGRGALTEKESREFHKWELDQFGEAGVDFLYAALIPTFPEAAGLAAAMAETGIPYIISFTIRNNGTLIDGTPICDAISQIDNRVSVPPICYMTNCVHPRIAYEALSQSFHDKALLKRRFLGIQANTAQLSYEELDDAKELLTSEPEALAEAIMALKEICSLKIYGGCCGTDGRHMREIARRL